MEKYKPTERVQKLRAEARKAVETHDMDLRRARREDGRYGWDNRQLMHFYEGWLAHSDAPTTLMRRVLAEADMIAREPVIIFEDDLICGRPDVSELTEQEAAYFDELRNAHLDLVPMVPGRTGHMALNYEKLLKLGIAGLLDEISHARQALNTDDIAEWTQANEFYDACEVQLNALLQLEERYAQAAREKGLTELAGLLERVPRYPAGSFREALQSMHFYSFILRDLFSCGRPDQYLIDYYRADIASGVLTEESALELIDCWNIQYTFYTRPLAAVSYIVGGHTPSGEPVENELTWLFLQSIAHVKLAYPSVGLAVSADTGRQILDYAIELIGQGYTHPALFNDEAITNSFISVGMKPEHARQYINSTCVENTPCGCSGCWGTSPYHSLPQLLMDMLEQNTQYSDFQQLYADYCHTVKKAVHKGQLEQNMLQMERNRNGGESPLASVLVDDCIKRGKSIDQGGALYNYIEPDFIGTSTVIDSLIAIRHCVFEKNMLSLQQFMEILHNNYAGHEQLWLYIINKCPHFGNNEQDTDSFAKAFYQMLADCCTGLKTFRNTLVLPGAFSFDMHEEMGRSCMATPDGRKAGEAFNGGSDPVSGRDRNGPTATINSDVFWNHQPFLGGIAVNIRLDFGDLSKRTIDNMYALIKTFIEKGGFELQINAVSPAVLEDAMKHPERYGDLLVRIGGYSDYFVRQSESLQRELISRSYGRL